MSETKTLPKTSEVAVAQIAKFVAASSVTYVVTQAITHNIDRSTLPRKVGAYIGTYVIVSAVAQKTEPVIDNFLDKMYDSYLLAKRAFSKN